MSDISLVAATFDDYFTSVDIDRSVPSNSPLSYVNFFFFLKPVTNTNFFAISKLKKIIKVKYYAGIYFD